MGTEKGDVAIWEAGFSEKLWEEPFFVWKAIPGANSQVKKEKFTPCSLIYEVLGDCNSVDEFLFSYLEFQ